MVCIEISPTTGNISISELLAPSTLNSFRRLLVSLKLSPLCATGNFAFSSRRRCKATLDFFHWRPSPHSTQRMLLTRETIEPVLNGWSLEQPPPQRARLHKHSDTYTAARKLEE